MGKEFIIREYKLHVYGKRQTSVKLGIFSKSKTARKILMDKKLRETTNLCLEVMNSKRQVKRKLGHVVQISESSCLVFST